MGAAQSAISPNDDQAVNSAFIEAAYRFTLTSGLFETLTATRLQNGASTLQDTPDITCTH
jgi:hypothetical protein